MYMNNYYQKYLKYKSKYINAKQILEAGAHLPHAEVIPAPETSTYPIATEVASPVAARPAAAASASARPAAASARSLPNREELKKIAKTNRDNFVKYVDFLRSIHKKEIFHRDEVFTRDRIGAREGTDHFAPWTTSSFGYDPKLYTDKYLLIFYYLLYNGGFNEANFIQAKREYEEIKRNSARTSRESPRARRESPRARRESPRARRESAGASKESAAAAAPASRYTATTPSATRDDLIRYAKSRRDLFKKFVKEMTDDRRTLIDRFYFTDERLGRGFGNDPNNYTDYILKIFKQFSIIGQDDEEMFTNNFSVNFSYLARKLFGEKLLTDFSIVKAGGLF
jgi:hypothetical protein